MLRRLLVVVNAHEAAAMALTAVAVREALDVAEVFDGDVLFVGVVPSLPIFVPEIPTASIFNLDALHCAGLARVRGRIDDAMRDAARRGVRAAHHLPSEPMHAKEIVSLAIEQRCDAIIIASEGHSAIGRLLAGSLIPGLVTHAPMPVLICKAPRSEAGGRPAKRAAQQIVDGAAALLRGRGAGIAGAPWWSIS